MWEYIVLGQVPGTQIQVSFENWLIIVTGILLALLVIIAARTATSKHPLTALRVSRVLQKAAYGQWLVSRRHIQA